MSGRLFIGQPGRPAIIAHRGASRIAPENTLAAFRLAWEMGSDAVELDLRLTSDGEIVVIHDDGVLRTTGLDACVGALQLEQIRRLDAGSYKEPRWQGERIPALREVLALVPPGKSVVLEIKDSAALLDPLERELAAATIEPRRIALIGFDHALMTEIRRRFPGHAVFWLYEFSGVEDPSAWSALRRRLISEIRRGGFDGIDLQAHAMLDAGFVREIHANGFLVMTWTVNDPAPARRLIGAGVDGIITDVPDLLLALRDGLAS